MCPKLGKKLRKMRPGMGGKFTISLLLIAAILLVSSLVSILEFRRMSTFVSDSMADNISVVNLSSDLAVAADEYNLRLLRSVGNADSLKVLDFDYLPYKESADSILERFTQLRLAGADSLRSAYERYMATSRQIDPVISSDFSDAREWYFTSLQPSYNDFRRSQDAFNQNIHDALRTHSESFDESFYRGIIPGVVSLGAGIILCLLLLFFVLTFYIRPTYKMLRNMESYRRTGQPYTVTFEGDDELQELNAGIGDLIDENITLKKRQRER